jgi:hypothetical protein
VNGEVLKRRMRAPKEDAMTLSHVAKALMKQNFTF